MSRFPLAALALVSGLAAAPAFAQGAAAGDPVATRTMQQNQSAFTPSPARSQAAQQKAVKEKPLATAPQAITGRRIALADGARR
ncbi:hypothetical protein [Roseicella aquatilis]|uniref:Uncharacterized protein n=1 Tax=Roseicella aquatilis TaxID=2527868 RepID=A0A4R4DQN6_9PROT|nr:hypothetical protein [Roseicella aquatilis]TCZ64331.1 hypothetical protein EXY23_06690 [Roseicella aquatilis]